MELGANDKASNQDRQRCMPTFLYYGVNFFCLHCDHRAEGCFNYYYNIYGFNNLSGMRETGIRQSFTLPELWTPAQSGIPGYWHTSPTANSRNSSTRQPGATQPAAGSCTSKHRDERICVEMPPLQINSWPEGSSQQRLGEMSSVWQCRPHWRRAECI